MANPTRDDPRIMDSARDLVRAKSILLSFEIMHQNLTGSGVKVSNLSLIGPLPVRLFAGRVTDSGDVLFAFLS